MYHFERIEDDLYRRISILRRQISVLGGNIRASQYAFDQMHKRHAETLSSVKKHFYAANEKIHDFAEEITNGECKAPE